ncbi:MAG TPA: MFS transporter [Chthoniobacterales bacterium]|nr:MFS transporter [Chthoniobacterales bacterium]
MMTKDSPGRLGARTAVALLLSINIFNYVDRQILAAVEPSIRAAFFLPGDKNALAISGSLGSAFLVTYMLVAPALGWLADRFSRWVIIGLAVIFWSFATAGSGLAATYGILFFTRILVGVGEGGYGPAAPTILADLFPIEKRGRIMSFFFAAIPVGSALGYVIGGAVLTHLTFVAEPDRWRWALCLVAVPGIALGLWCFLQRDPRAVHGVRPEKQRAKWGDYLTIIRTPSFLINCGAQTAMTFAAGGIGWWIAAYLKDRGLPSSSTEIFGVIIAVAGLTSTLIGGWLADRLRNKYRGSYFLVSGWGMLCAFPLFVAMLFTPFPFAWLWMFGSVFFLFLNTGPSNTALANVTSPKVRATAFAFNILMLHMFGDVPAFPAIGYVAGHSNWTTAFLVVSGMMLLAGVLWLIGAKFLPRDIARVEAAAA